MTQVVYADILFIVNVYVTYALLALTDMISGKTSGRLLKVVGAILGGAYSFIIFIPSIPDWAVTVSRLVFAALLVFVVYGKQTRKRFFISFAGFFLVNFIFAGLMFALWYIVSPPSMMYYGSVVYFDIDALTLVILTIICYAVISGIDMLIKARSPCDTQFRLSVYFNNKCVTCDAFFDTGNSVIEPFTSLPVIIMDESILGELLPDEKKLEAKSAAEISFRYIPCTYLSGSDALKAFKPDKIHIKGIKTDIETNRVFIALTDKKIKGGEYGALLNSALITR